jgi:uncharacterized RDD family membrane protein YckC
MPPSTTPSMPDNEPGLPASLGKRMACWMYEGILLFGVVFIAGYLFGTLSQTRNALDNRHGLQAFVFLIFGIYFTWFWHKGQTLAMKTWHITIVSNQGLPISQQRALLRYFLSWIWLIPPLLVSWLCELKTEGIFIITAVWIFLWAFSSRLRSDHQFWHDAWAGTRLIQTPRSKP